MRANVMKVNIKGFLLEKYPAAYTQASPFSSVFVAKPPLRYERQPIHFPPLTYRSYEIENINPPEPVFTHPPPFSLLNNKREHQQPFRLTPAHYITSQTH